MLMLFQLTQTFTVEKVKEMLAEIVKSCLEKAREQQRTEGYLKLERGFATIPLPGIDVPFHSRYLWAGVMPFRACKCILAKKLISSFFYRFIEENQSCWPQS